MAWAKEQARIETDYEFITKRKSTAGKAIQNKPFCGVFPNITVKDGNIPPFSNFVNVTFVILHNKQFSFLAERLADYEIPREFVFLKEFPKTESGKIRKKEL